MSETQSAEVSVSMREALGDIYDQMEGAGAPEGDVISGAEPVGQAPEPEAEEFEDVEEIELAEPPAETYTAPAHWSKERRELFASATPEIQRAWLDREKEYDRGFQEKSQELATYKQAIEPVRQFNQLRGIDDAMWLRQMAGYTMALEQDPLGVIRAVAQQYGVDLGQLSPVQQADDEFVDPQVKELRDQLQTLQRQIADSQQAAQRDTVSAQQRMVEQFRDEKDATGNPAHPHFDAVYDDMLVLAKGYQGAGKQIPPLADLYSRAVRMRDDLNQPAKAQVSDLEKAQRAKRARSAAARPSASVATGEPTKPRTLRDELADTWAQLENRS